MKAVAVLVLLCAAVAAAAAAETATVAARFEKRRVKAHAQSHVLANGARVECDRISSCEACAEKQYVNGVMVSPCYWDHLSRSCNFNKRESWFCDGNVGFPTAECQRCEKRAAEAKAAQAKQAEAAKATAAAQAGAAKAAGKAGKYCQLSGGYKGICVTTTDRCTGGRPFARTGCMDPNMICCGLINKTSKSKDSKRDSNCSKFNGAGKCWDCLRAGCEMHIGTAACTHSRSAFARSGDKNVVGSEAMCYLVGKAQKAAREKVKARAAAKRNAGKKF